MGETEIDKSGYNEASFKMQRLHESQRRISYVNQDLLKYYHELNGFGYIVKKSELGNLFQEVWGKLDDANKKKVKDLKVMMDNILELFPIQVVKIIIGAAGEKKIASINNENFKRFSDLLFEAHSYVNELLEKAGYSTFTIEADDGDPYN